VSTYVVAVSSCVRSGGVVGPYHSDRQTQFPVQSSHARSVLKLVQTFACPTRTRSTWIVSRRYSNASFSTRLPQLYISLHFSTLHCTALHTKPSRLSSLCYIATPNGSAGATAMTSDRSSLHSPYILFSPTPALPSLTILIQSPSPSRYPTLRLLPSTLHYSTLLHCTARTLPR
jgi:hypothetical protein